MIFYPAFSPLLSFCRLTQFFHTCTIKPNTKINISPDIESFLLFFLFVCCSLASISSPISSSDEDYTLGASFYITFRRRWKYRDRNYFDQWFPDPERERRRLSIKKYALWNGGNLLYLNCIVLAQLRGAAKICRTVCIKIKVNF